MSQEPHAAARGSAVNGRSSDTQAGILSIGQSVYGAFLTRCHDFARSRPVCVRVQPCTTTVGSIG